MITEHPNYGKGIKVNLDVNIGDTYAIPLENEQYVELLIHPAAVAKSFKVF